MATGNQEFGTIIGSDARFKGEFAFDSAAKVLGSIEGSITSTGTVHIADGSKCKATVDAKEISIEGEIEGNIAASDRVEVKPNGRVQGDVTAAKMTMAEGASIDGYCRIGKNGQASPSSARTSTQTEVKPPAQQQPAQAQKAAAKSS